MQQDVPSTTVTVVSFHSLMQSWGNSWTNLSIINLARREQGIQRVIAGDQKAGKVNEELASNVEEDQEEVNADKAEENIDLRDRGLFLQIVKSRILGKLQ